MTARFPALSPEAEGLQDLPEPPLALARRMAELWGCGPEEVLPVRGATHGYELILRKAALDGAAEIAVEAEVSGAALERLAAIYMIDITEHPGPATAAVIARSPSDPLGVLLDPDVVRRRASEVAPALFVVDESDADVTERPSLAALAGEIPNLVVLRSLSGLYGLAGARCGALIASEATLKSLAAVMEPHALATPVVRLAEKALSPARAILAAGRADLIRAERARVAAALSGDRAVRKVIAGEGGYVYVVPADLEGARAGFARFGVEADARRQPEPGGFRLDIGPPAANDRALAALGIAVPTTIHRRAEVVRDTKETRIAVSLDLDGPGRVKAETGVGYFDHMLEQIAFHGGFAMSLSCAGDLHIDTHHTIEDCAIALGTALKQALGDRRGIARFGFLLPMDETEAKVSIDLSGRPFCVFKGAFKAALLGEYPTEMTAHVFRSLAESLGAAIHVEVQGDNDHHKTEACFKAFGRALRQAIRIEGAEVPSTKGVL